MFGLALLAQSDYTTLTSGTGGDEAVATGVGIFIIVFWLFFMAFALVSFVLWVMSLIHVIQHEDVKDRIVWIIMLVAFGGLAGLIYHFVVRRPYEAARKNGFGQATR